MNSRFDGRNVCVFGDGNGDGDVGKRCLTHIDGFNNIIIIIFNC